MLSSGLAGQHLLTGIVDSIELDYSHKKWGIDGDEMIKKIKSLSPFECACLELWGNGYWYAKDELPDLDGYVNSLTTDKEKE
jgi:hypothetical protein